MKRTFFLPFLLVSLLISCNKPDSHSDYETTDYETSDYKGAFEDSDSAALHGTSYLDNDETYNVDSIYNRVKEYDHDVNCDREGIEDLNKQTVIEAVVLPERVVEKKNDGPMNMAMVEQKPSFPGGDGEMVKWIADNIIYPSEVAEEGVTGKVTVSFIVEKDGSITDIKVVRGKHPALDAEAVRVVKKMPKWIPGRNNGEPVRVTYMLPIPFKSH